MQKHLVACLVFLLVMIEQTGGLGTIRPRDFQVVFQNDPVSDGMDIDESQVLLHSEADKRFQCSLPRIEKASMATDAESDPESELKELKRLIAPMKYNCLYMVIPFACSAKKRLT